MKENPSALARPNASPLQGDDDLLAGRPGGRASHGWSDWK